MRGGKLLARISDQLEGAPETVLASLAHILLAKLYRMPVERAHALRYRKYVSAHDVNQKAHLVRQVRGRKQLRPAQGKWYDLDGIFDSLNTKFFHGLLGRPRMSWSQRGARNLLGHYDPAHNAIIISRVFDHFAVPRCAVEYIVYHEMLHLKHPGPIARQPALRAFGGISGRGKTVSPPGRRQAISATDVRHPEFSRPSRTARQIPSPGRKQVDPLAREEYPCISWN